MSVSMMPIRVLLFARYAELLGHSELTLEIPQGSSVGEALEQVRALPGGAALPARLLVARGVDQVDHGAQLSPGDELALLPPMSGG